MNFDYFKSISAILKIANLVLIIVTMGIYFSTFTLNWIFFMGSMIVCGMVFTFIILINYALGGMAVQQTFYELLMNGFFAIMFFSAAIVGFVHGEVGGKIIATGVFFLLSFAIFGADIYFSLVNMGAFNRQSSPDPPSTHTNPPHLNPGPASMFNPTTPPVGTDHTRSPFPPMPSQMDNSQGIYSYSSSTSPATISVT